MTAMGTLQASSFDVAPLLRTPRLVLRGATMADFPAYRDFVTGPRTTWMDGPHDAAKAWAWFTNDVAGWALMGMGGLIVTHEGRAVGAVGLTQSPDFPEPELGWFLYDGCEGQGFATEAAGALRDWALGPRGLASVVSYVDPANLASIRVALRLGAVLDPQAATPGGQPTLVYRHRRPA